MIHRLWPVALGVWLVGLWAQTGVQTASLPGLSARRALLLNATGSAVSNIMPLGSALGVEANRRMVRRWGFSLPAFAGYVALTNVAAIVSKLLLPVVALVLVLYVSAPAGALVGLASIGSLAAGLLVLTLSSARMACAADRTLNRLLSGVDMLLTRPSRRPLPYLTALRADCAVLAGRHWPKLVSATVAYYVLQGVLLWVCLSAVGAAPTLVGVAAALAVERAATLLVVVPAGLGVAEVAAAAVLVSLGTPAAAAAAALLLHRIFVVALEVPLGALLGGLWWLGDRRVAS